MNASPQPTHSVRSGHSIILTKQAVVPMSPHTISYQPNHFKEVYPLVSGPPVKCLLVGSMWIDAIPHS